jgi:Protein of unknown function (DUF2442)
MPRSNAPASGADPSAFASRSRVAVSNSARSVRVPMPPLDPRPIGVQYRPGRLEIRLADGRAISAPLRWFPALDQAVRSWERSHDPEDDLEGGRLRYTLGASSVQWPELDVDVSVLALLGLPDA